MPDVESFRYTGMVVDLPAGVITFNYLLHGPSAHYPLSDVFTFPVPDQLPDAPTRAAITRVLELLYLAAGLTYYKAAAPRRVVVDAIKLTPAARCWVHALYRQGLSEFAFRNKLPHLLDIEVICETTEAGAGDARLTTNGRRPLVAVGGGKDSIVSVETLKAGGFQPAVFAMVKTPLLSDVMRLTKSPMFEVARLLDSRVVPVLALEGSFKGHVPSTATNSLIGVVTALLNGLGPVVLSNERSASSPNLVWQNRQVNHQWAKSLDAEGLLRAAIDEQAGLENACFSLLSGMSELHIARLFAALPGYDTKVTSCNAAYRRFGDRRAARWCTRCDKCRFVFLALAPFMDRHRLVTIFGQDLLTDHNHLGGYRELLGLSGHKPFECVGEVSESRVAVRLLAEHPSWRDASVIQTLRAELTDWPADAEVRQVFTASSPRFAPPAYARALAAAQAVDGLSPAEVVV